MTHKGTSMKNRPLTYCFIVALSVLLHPQLASAQTPPSAPAAEVAPTIPAPPAAPSLVYKEGVIKVGSELKQTRGRVTDVDKGDNGCYLTIRNEKNNEFIEVGVYPICMQKPPLKGKQVELTYSMETIQAGDCYGDPKCKRTETIPVVTSVKILD